jgi:hypothetical protein
MLLTDRRHRQHFGRFKLCLWSFPWRSLLYCSRTPGPGRYPLALVLYLKRSSAVLCVKEMEIGDGIKVFENKLLRRIFWYSRKTWLGWTRLHNEELHNLYSSPNIINPLKPKLVLILFKNSIRTEKKTLHFTVTKINRLTLFKEIIAVYSENHTKLINTKWKVTDCWSRWRMQLCSAWKSWRGWNRWEVQSVFWSVKFKRRDHHLLRPRHRWERNVLLYKCI